MSSIFPKWMNALPTLAAFGSMGGVLTVVVGTWYWATPDFFEVGYEPTQPGSGFSHKVHVGKLGMDCLYCHTNVKEGPEANIPPVSTCFGCHATGLVSAQKSTATDDKVQFIRDAIAPASRWKEVEELHETGQHAEAEAKLVEFREQGLDVSKDGGEIQWRRVHKLPDYVRNFPHDVHVNAGVSCYSCHGQIASMPVVFQAESLSMGWCLECHRNPEEVLVPPEKVTDLLWVEKELAARSAGAGAVNTQVLTERLWDTPPQACGACHQ